MKPPYSISEQILKRIASISEKIGEVKSAHLSKPPTELRRKNRIKTIQSSLEIEGNTLTFEQITAIFENKRVIAPKKDIIEVKNAIKVYNTLNSFNPKSLKSLCDAHKILMEGLVESSGKLRGKSVGIIHGSQIAHVAPPGEMVKPLMNDLFKYLKSDPDLGLIKSCVFHYELEFIHPFMDGNGRMGRLWQTLILKGQNPVFEFLPIESLVKKKQSEYYLSLKKSDKSGNSTQFIEFMLEVIDESLESLLQTQNLTLTVEDRINLYKDVAKGEFFTRQEYLRYFKKISSATASRDLKMAVDNNRLIKTGDKRTSKYQFI
jgi:Fic family protein